MPVALRRHRELAARIEPLRRARSIEEAIDIQASILATTRAWRLAQPVESLLDADVAGILGERHRHLARALRRAQRASAMPWNDSSAPNKKRPS